MKKIINELGEPVPHDYLLDIIGYSKDAEDFLEKVNLGITDEFSNVTEENDKRITEFYYSIKNII